MSPSFAPDGRQECGEKGTLAKKEHQEVVPEILDSSKIQIREKQVCVSVHSSSASSIQSNCVMHLIIKLFTVYGQ